MKTTKPRGAAGRLMCALALTAAAVCPRAMASAERGATVFATNCAVCHSVAPQRNKVGPSLFGVVGRHAASIADFRYSDAMNRSGIVWTPDRLDAYITRPKAVVPGCAMPFPGLADAAQRADLIDFLAAQK